MSFLNKITALIPLGKKEEILEYFFALNISLEKLTCALWMIEGKQLKILETASENYSSLNEITEITDKLLDQTLGIREVEPQKILFGVPNSWLSDENLKEDDLKILRKMVKELELTPMAYVENSHALVHFLDKQEGIPTTAILVGFEMHHLTVTVVRAGKLDGVKIVSRAENSGEDIEKALLTFTDVKTLPSKILIYGQQGFSESSRDNGGLKDQLLAFPWMSKLSFLHFPKIEILQDDIDIKSVCFAGGSEIESNILYTEHSIKQNPIKSSLLLKDEENVKIDNESDKPEPIQKEDLGFMAGDISIQQKKEEIATEDFQDETEDKEADGQAQTEKLMMPQEANLTEIEDFDRELSTPVSAPLEKQTKKFSFKKFLPGKGKKTIFFIGILGVLFVILAAYLFLPKAQVKIFVEPKILDNDAQVIADPNQKTVNEESKIIPGQIIETDISGTAKDSATGKKQVGDPSKGTVVIINNTADGQNFSAGTVLTAPGGLKFKLDKTASVSATLADADSKSTVTVTVTAVEVGADGNLPSKTNLTIASYPNSQFVARAEGNFSGGTSKEVVVVSSDDQQKLLAKLSSDLKQQAQQKLQEKYSDKKVIQEALLESIVRKSYNKNVNDQANEFSLNLTIHYKGTTFNDADLRSIVSKLVNTQVPDGFQIDLSDTETQADVSKIEKDGKLIFLARFKTKLLPKIDTEKVKNQIKGKSLGEAVNIIKGMENVLGSEIKISPSLPPILQRLPLMGKNIKIEVGLK